MKVEATARLRPRQSRGCVVWGRCPTGALRGGQVVADDQRHGARCIIPERCCRWEVLPVPGAERPVWHSGLRDRTPFTPRARQWHAVLAPRDTGGGRITGFMRTCAAADAETALNDRLMVCHVQRCWSRRRPGTRPAAAARAWTARGRPHPRRVCRTSSRPRLREASQGSRRPLLAAAAAAAESDRRRLWRGPSRRVLLTAVQQMQAAGAPSKAIPWAEPGPTPPKAGTTCASSRAP